MTALDWTFDILIAGCLLWLAWQSLADEDMIKSATIFIVFGLVVALTWCRLAAPDVALAEAAIGAGLTGALLLRSLRRIAETQHDAQEHSGRGDRREE